jgi:type IV pilus assembly protein PilY1
MLKKYLLILPSICTWPLLFAQNIVLQDNFTGASAAMDWVSFNGACLTAGNGSGTIPACYGLPYYSGVVLKGGATGTLPDATGSGALRFTNNSNYQTGAIISNFTFPSSSGIAVTFATITYGGSGADGMTFFLMDGSKAPTPGASGGSLGYSCSNANPIYNGVVGAYIGLGIDEYGNFLNSGDNTATGNGFQAGRIGLRGAGSIAWSWLNSTYPSYYPSSFTAAQQKTAVWNACKTGYIVDTSGVNKGNILDYAIIAGGYKTLPSTTPISTGSATTRSAAKPITYQLKITQDGFLTLNYSYNGGTFQPVLTNQSITGANGTPPATYRFGFTGSTGGANNIHEVTCFQAGPTTLSASSASSNTKSGELNTGTQVFLSSYQPNNWWGQLTANNLVFNATTNNLAASAIANWDASCVLTGGVCTATNVASVTAQGSSSRNILTWDGSTGIPFQWANLNATQKSALTAGDATPVNSNRWAYLRGDRTNENTSGAAGTFRQRTGVLGDIVDSSPTLVAAPSATAFTDTWKDVVYPAATHPENSTSATKYSSFVASNKNRLNVVYAGANDGLLHGFRAGAFNSAGVAITPGTLPNDGREVLAYMPGYTLQTIHSTTTANDFANTQYGHAFNLDATPTTGELFYNNSWHTWLVSGLGPGGNAIFALDVTDPTQFAEANASTLVMGEWTSSTISCTNVTNCGQNMGNTFGTPAIRRFHNGKWGFVFGNGLNSTTGKAGIYVVTIDPSSAAQTVYYLDTGSGSSTTPNGITFTSPSDLDSDHITDYVYAGDIKGNIWRFDLTSNLPSAWAASKYGNTTATPLFTTANNAPITTKAIVIKGTRSTAGTTRVVVNFGTGQKTPQTTSSAATYATGTQTLYGVWDWDMDAWNVLAGSGAAAAKMTSLTAPQTITANSTSLTNQTITATFASGGINYRQVSNSSVAWKDLPSGTKYGWYLDMPTSQEQVIYNPTIIQGAFVVNTSIPANNTPLNCSNSLDSGWTMAIDPLTGGALKTAFFTINGKNVSGINNGSVGTAFVITYNGKSYLMAKKSDGTLTSTVYNPPGGFTGSRLNWHQIR